MLGDVVPCIVNVVQLALIDEDAEIRAMALRIILKFTTNWEINENRFRNIIIFMDIHSNILELEQDKEEKVYNRALDVIEELKLDDLD